MRQIKFRAKRLRNNEWIIGDLSHTKYSNGRVNITMWEQTPCAELNIEIDKDTIGQYTGLKDKEGKEIYEGDILKFYYKCSWAKEYDAVYFLNGEYRVGDFRLNQVCLRSEVIGNIYENQDLLVGK